jgi:hypothetical protein
MDEETVTYAYIYTYLCIILNKRKEILSFVTAWMNLQSIRLGEISQTQKDKRYRITLTCTV